MSEENNTQNSDLNLNDKPSAQGQASSVKTGISLSKKIIFSFIILIVLLVAIEIFARLLGWKSFPNIPYADSDYEAEWELKKNYDDDSWLVRENPDGSKTKIRIKTNSFGLRCNEFPKEKPAGEYRILFLGDSVTFGFKLNQNETLPSNLERVLSSSIHNLNIRVINAGVDGYATFQEAYFLKRRGVEFAPDIVLVGFVLNDVFEPHLTAKAKGGTGNYAGLAGSKTFLRSITRTACRSAFFNHIFFKYLEIKNNARKQKHEVGGKIYKSRDEIYNTEGLFKDELSPEIEQAWQDLEKDLLKLKQFADEIKIPVRIIIFPYAAQVVEKIWSHKPQERLIEFCKTHQIEYLDLAPYFLQNESPVELFLQNDGNHLSPKGSEYVASIIAENIKPVIEKSK